jgi:hypothetical protein
VRDADEYLAYVKALIIVNDQISHWTTVREEAQGDTGLFRYRLMLRNGDLLEVFERFQVSREAVVVQKYSFHWQKTTGELYKRWDNAPHHRDLLTQPHHVHEGAEDHVRSHEPMTVEAVMAMVSAQVSTETEPAQDAHLGDR